MLFAEETQVIAQGKKKIVASVVARAKERSRFRNQLPQMLHLFRCRFRRCSAVRGDVNAVLRLLASGKLEGTQKRAGQYRGINERRQRCWLEFNLV